MTTINTNYSVPAFTVTEQTKARISTESEELSEGKELPHSEKSATVEISQDGINSYKESLVKSATTGLQQSENGKGVIMTDFSTLIGSRMPSIYGEKNESGEYSRNYFSTSEAASNILKAYAGLYDEIVTGYEAGTRETYVEDKTSESGYRKLTMDEELEELNKAYKDYADRYATNRDKNVIDILSAHAKKVSELSSGRTAIANEANALLEKYKNDPVPDDFSDKMMKAANSFVAQYKANRGLDINSLLSGITIFAK